MVIEFNKFNNRYNNYNFLVGAAVSKQVEKTEDTKEAEKLAAQEFIGLEDDTDLLTQNTKYLYGVKLGKFTAEDKDIADETNRILATLGYDYKVSAAQVASVANGVNTVVKPGLELAANGAVAARIADPNGPFADLFA